MAAKNLSANTSELFSPVSGGRISVEIVEQVKAAVSAGHLGPGDRLPSERDLTERFGVSRVTVRDALRILEATGLIEVRVGARGGAFITAPAPALVGEGFANMLLLSSVTPAEVTEARFIFELGMIPLICERATDEDIANLTAICERSEEALRAGNYQVSMSAEFHTRLAQASHNDAIKLIVDSFQGPLLMSLIEAKERAPQMGDPGVKEHRQLVKAISRRDGGRAHDIMSRHLGRTARRLGTRPVAVGRADVRRTKDRGSARS